MKRFQTMVKQKKELVAYYVDTLKDIQERLRLKKSQKNGDISCRWE